MYAGAPPQQQQQQPQPMPQPLGAAPVPYAQPYASRYGPPPAEGHPVGASDGVYGQNTNAAQADRSTWQSQQQRAAQPVGYGPYTQSAPPVGATYAVVNDPYYQPPPTLRVPVGPPSGVVAGPGDVEIVVVAAFRVTAVIACFICIGLAIVMTIQAATVQSSAVAYIVIAVLAYIAFFVLGWGHQRRQVQFVRGASQVRCAQKRLLLYFCGDEVTQSVPFSELEGVAIETAGTAGAAALRGALFLITSGGGRIELGFRGYASALDMEADLMQWRGYIAGLRGVSLNEFLSRFQQVLMSIVRSAA